MKPFIIVPVKRFPRSKTRLAPTLSAQERQTLSICMLEDVLTAIQNTEKFDCTLLVGPDDPSSTIAKNYGTSYLGEVRQESMNASVNKATKWCISREADSTLIIPSDIPLVKPGDLDEIICLCDASTQVILCPSSNGTGTNALLRVPSDIIPPCYGRNSFQKHIRKADRKGIPYRIHRSKRISLDIDTIEDLKQFFRYKAKHTKTYQFIKDTGLERRITV